MRTMERRLKKIEANSKWGSAAEIEASDTLFMRIPEGMENDPRVNAAMTEADRKNKLLCATSSPAAASLPFWALVPLDRIPDALLDARIAELRLAAGLSDADLDTTIAELPAAIAQEECNL